LTIAGCISKADLLFIDGVDLVVRSVGDEAQAVVLSLDQFPTDTSGRVFSCVDAPVAMPDVEKRAMKSAISERVLTTHS
jgi:hypothetical protein